MKFTPTDVEGVFIVDQEPRGDDRGWFTRVWCEQELSAAGLPAHVSQVNMSYNHQAGTLRGLHLQRPPHHESKMVQCLTGAIVDVAVDVRPDSPTFLQHVVVELRADSRRALQLPAYVAHGYQTLVEGTTVMYHVDGPYAPQAEVGFRHDDETFGVQWPLPVADLSDKDASWPRFDPAAVAPLS